jgi:hypothetical protein
MYLLEVFLFINLAVAFYVPGVTPRDYKVGEAVDLHVNALSSLKKSVRENAVLYIDISIAHTL